MLSTSGRFSSHIIKPNVGFSEGWTRPLPSVMKRKLCRNGTASNLSQKLQKHHRQHFFMTRHFCNEVLNPTVEHQQHTYNV